MKDTRRKFMPKERHFYQNKDGRIYQCIHAQPEKGTAIMKDINSGWTLQAHGCGIYRDGTIDWDYSTGDYDDETYQP
jgi:hypothetical protein